MMAFTTLYLLSVVLLSHGVEASRFFGLSSSVFGGLPQSVPQSVPQKQQQQQQQQQQYKDNHGDMSSSFYLSVRGGDEETLTLDEKVRKAMSKLGLGPPKAKEPTPPPTTTTTTTTASSAKDEECKDGVCPMPDDTATTPASNEATSTSPSQKQLDMNVEQLADKIANDMNVHPSLAMAALGATSKFETTDPTSRKYNEALARNMIQQELDMMENISEDSKEVQQLVTEGYDTFLARRALAFSENNIEDARAILLADKLDEEEEAREARHLQHQQSLAASDSTEKQAEQQPKIMKTVNVDANFDPAAIGTTAPTVSPDNKESEMPKAARKEDVVFEATTAQIQELVIDSPVPVLLDIYADWCGPCKVLGPALEDMAIKSGGIFRLVKVNSDNERPVSQALEVTALPTVFGIKDGKIVHMFQGMPKSEEHMKNFMMGLLMPGAKFDPPVPVKESEKYEELSLKLIKVAGAASFSFQKREMLQDRIFARLDELVEAQNGDLVDTEESVQILRSLLSNIISSPFETKFRRVNLANKVLSQKIANFQSCIAILKNVGFSQDGPDAMVIAKGKRVVNVAPLTVARDQLDKWIDKTRYDVAKAARARKDEQMLKELEESGALDEEEDEEEEKEEESVDPNQCIMKVRVEGKKKVHEVKMHADDPLSKVIESVPLLAGQKDEMQITCVAKRLIVKTTDEDAMRTSLRDCKLLPTAALVVKIGAGDNIGGSAKGSLAERAAAERKKKKGSHTMQSIGVYAKDDNLKGEMIDGGGGVMYEQDVSDTEDEAPEGDEAAAEYDTISANDEAQEDEN